MSQEYIVKTWPNIAKLTPYDEQTLRKKYGPEMLEKGFVLKSRFGRRKGLTVWAFPSQVIKYFTVLGQKNEII